MEGQNLPVTRRHRRKVAQAARAGDIRTNEFVAKTGPKVNVNGAATMAGAGKLVAQVIPNPFGAQRTC